MDAGRVEKEQGKPSKEKRGYPPAPETRLKIDEDRLIRERRKKEEKPK